MVVVIVIRSCILIFCTIAGPRPARPFYLVHPAQHHGGSHDEYTKVSQIFHKFIILGWHDFISCVRFWDTEVLTDCWDFSHCGCSSWVDPERWAPYFSTTYQSTRNMVNEWTLFIGELMWMDLDSMIQRSMIDVHTTKIVLLILSTPT